MNVYTLHQSLKTEYGYACVDKIIAIAIKDKINTDTNEL